jgi:cytochrome c-type biogenesis protein CcmH
MKKILGLFFILTLTNLAIAQNENPADKSVLQTSIQNELACFCGCGMTIQGCLGGMICSESKTVSKQVGDLLDQGKGKAEVLQVMGAQYGERILAAPTKKGFNLTAWILPFVALVIGGVIVAKVIAGWKRQSQGQIKLQESLPQNSQEKKAPDDPYADRFEREWREFDR